MTSVGQEVGRGSLSWIHGVRVSAGKTQQLGVICHLEAKVIQRHLCLSVAVDAGSQLGQSTKAPPHGLSFLSQGPLGGLELYK